MSGKVNPRKDDGGQWPPARPANDDEDAGRDSDKTGGAGEDHHHSEGPGGGEDHGTAYSPKWFP